MALNKQDIAFLKEMIGHHEAALVMAGKVIKSGEDASVKSLAESIVSTQTKEITKMKGLLKDAGQSTTGSSEHSGHMGKSIDWSSLFR